MKALSLVMILILLPGYAFAQGTTQITISTDKASYATGDTISISGTLSFPGDSNSAVIQVYDPHNILIQIATVSISPDGKFSTSIKAEGPSWQKDGAYIIKIIYVSPPVNAVSQKSINFKTQTANTTNPPVNTSPNTIPQNYTTITQDQNQSSFEQQVQQRIEFAKKLRASLNNTENQNSTIPFWVKDTARKWHDGTADNESFGKVIQYMISSGLVTPNYSITPSDAFDHVPPWLKNTAQWWTQGIVSDNTFYDSIQFLLDKKIIQP